MTEKTELVHYEAADQVATITMDSPANHNALSQQLIAALFAQFERASSEPSVRAVLLTHTGPTFSAGADLTEARNRGVEQSAKDLVALLRKILALPVPVIARVNGKARAGGLGILGACDIVVASAASDFAFTEARIGLAPAVISLTVAHRMLRRAQLRYYLTGEIFYPIEAKANGLITDFGEDLEVLLKPILRGLRSGSPQGLSESKNLCNAGILAALDADAGQMTALAARLFASVEAREGMSAFLARRPPSWLGAAPPG